MRKVSWVLAFIAAAIIAAFANSPARAEDGEVKELDREAVTKLENTMKARNLPLFGAPGVNSSLEALYFNTAER